MRDPEERNPRIGGMTARGDAAPDIFGALKETGGRDLRLSSDLVASTALGSSSSRWPCAQSFVALSEATRRGCVKVARLAEGVLVPFDTEMDSAGAGARRCRGLAASVVSERSAAAVGESGKDAGRLEAAGVEVWNVDALILEGLNCELSCACSSEEREDFWVSLPPSRSWLSGDGAGMRLLRGGGLLFGC